MEITWLGHASFKLKTKDGKVIYIDPYFGEYNETADLILVSHGHYDHASMEKIRQVSNDATIILTTADVASMIHGAEVLGENQEKIIGNIRVTTVPMYSRTHARGSGIGFLIEAEKIVVYFAGDTDLIPEMKEIKAQIALLPVGGTYTMNGAQAAEAALLIKPRLAIPMHYGSGIVGTMDDAEIFKETVESKSEIQVKIMQQGEVISV